MWVSAMATIIRYIVYIVAPEILEHLGPVPINFLGRWRGTVFASNPRKDRVDSFPAIESGVSAMILSMAESPVRRALNPSLLQVR